MEQKKRAYCVIASDSALLQEASAGESGDSAPIAGCSGPVPMVWAPRAARGGPARAVYTRRAHQCERSRSRLGAPIAPDQRGAPVKRSDVLAPAEGLPPSTALKPRPRLHGFCTVFGFCYLFVWGYIADLSMVPRLRRGRLASRALRPPFISCAVKTRRRVPFPCVPDRPSKIPCPCRLGPCPSPTLPLLCLSVLFIHLEREMFLLFI